MLQTETLTRIDFDLGTPWNVVFYDDNVTSMDFVVTTLISIFNKSKEEATELMLLIHMSGKAVVGSYCSYDIAEQKVYETAQFALVYGFPLKAKIEN